MVDSKTTQLIALTAVDKADILYIIDDVAGTPTSKKTTVEDVLQATNTLDNNTSVVSTDIMLIVDDPAGTPVAEKRTVNEIVGSVGLLKAGGTLNEGANIVGGTTTGTKIGTATNQKFGFYNATPIIQPTSLTAKLTLITHTAPVTPDYAIQDLTDTSPFGFVTKDEGNSVLKVIENLQTRVDELETKLQSLGFLA